MQDKTIEPIWKENYSAIAMSSSEEYLPYLCVCLQSLIDNTDKKHNYDIIIFSSCENEEKKNIVTSKYSKKNISIRFYNPKRHFENIKINFVVPRFTESCYYRIAVSDVMPNYKKVVFTDIDLIFNCNIKELYKIDISNYTLAACIDIPWRYFCERGNRKINCMTYPEYGKNILKLKDLKQYYNTGVALINIEEFKKHNYSEKLKELMIKNEYQSLEQDALNHLLNGSIKKISWKWNVEASERYSQTFKDYKIIHWLGSKKPWKYPDRPFARLWWKYARKTPFFNIIKIKKHTKLRKILLALNS